MNIKFFHPLHPDVRPGELDIDTLTKVIKSMLAAGIRPIKGDILLDKNNKPFTISSITFHADYRMKCCLTI